MFVYVCIFVYIYVCINVCACICLACVCIISLLVSHSAAPWAVCVCMWNNTTTTLLGMYAVKHQLEPHSEGPILSDVFVFIGCSRQQSLRKCLHTFAATSQECKKSFRQLNLWWTSVWHPFWWKSSVKVPEPQVCCLKFKWGSSNTISWDI